MHTVFPRDMVCLRNMSVDTLHKGDTEDDDDDNNGSSSSSSSNNNNNNNTFNCKWAVAQWQWLQCMYINMK